MRWIVERFCEWRNEWYTYGSYTSKGMASQVANVVEALYATETRIRTV